jgi:hypothetical protein
MRETTTDELVKGFRYSLTNLALDCERFRDHVEGVIAERAASSELSATRPEYDLSAISDIASQLRKLITTRRGDNLLERVCDRMGIAIPSVSIGLEARHAAPRWDKVIIEHFALGAIPTERGDTATPVTEFRDRACLVLFEGGQQETLTWGELIRDVANKDGVHLDDQRPVVWDYINNYHIGSVPAIPFLLYRLAVSVLEAGDEVLKVIGAEPVQANVPTGLGGMKAYAVVVTRYKDRQGPRPGRNDPCPCGSGKKFKRCFCAEVG